MRERDILYGQCEGSKCNSVVSGVGSEWTAWCEDFASRNRGGVDPSVRIQMFLVSG